MELEFDHAGLSVSFECDKQDYYSHTDILNKLTALVEELANHSGVHLVIMSNIDASEDND